MSTRYYAGIGSRETPPEILCVMTRLATKLASEGWILRSGHARGADLAFESGTTSEQQRDIYTANSLLPAWSYEQAAQFHPNWPACKPYARALHARNSLILFGSGPDPNSPNYPAERRVQFITCWTPNGAIAGGTGQALRIADHYNIPVRNLANPATLNAALAYLA